MIHVRFSIQMLQAVGAWLGTMFVLLLLSVGAPNAAHGQATDVQSLLERGRAAGADVSQMKMIAQRARQSGLGAETTASLLRPAVALAEQGLPASPLLSKTLEGLAKRVPAGRMQPVLQQYQAHTEQAGQIVGRWQRRSEVRKFLGGSEGAREGPPAKNASDPLVTAVAEARQQEIPADNIEAFLNGLPDGVDRRPVSLNQVATAVSVLPDLPESGVSPETARQLLTSALDAGYSPESLRQLPSALKSAHQRSKRPVDVLASGAAKAMAKGTPATKVLRSLFQGGVPGGGPPAGANPPGNTPGTGKPPNAGPPDDPGGGGSGGGPPGGGPPGGGGGSL